MNGALMKASSRFAIAAALGLIVGVGSANAADLGGNCCADLEERIAELEATTARKGNRKMSLTITGQVHRTVLWWDDGHSSRTYYGLDNTNSSSRFIMLGSAKVNPKVSMGFEIMIEIEAGGTSSKVNQLDEDGKIAHSSPLGNNVSFNQSNVDSYFGDARRVAWWIEHADVGRMTVGRFDSAGVVNTIDLGGIGVVASSSFALVNGSFFLRGSNGQFFNMTWANLVDPAASQGRVELVRYDSPNWQGFIYSASIAEAGDYWGHMLRYANEFNGVRVAAGIGYEKSTDRATPVTVDPTNTSFIGPRPNITAWGGALSLMHVPSGLFIQGHYQTADFNDPGHVANGYWGSTGGATKKDADQWLIQAGIAKNWFGIGNTALYGEYGRANDWGAETNGRNFAGATACTSPPFTGLCANNFSTIAGVVDTEVTVWGVGLSQNVDAAAATLYLGYRNFSAEVVGREGTTATNATVVPPTVTVTATGTHRSIPVEDFHAVIGGAIVRF